MFEIKKESFPEREEGVLQKWEQEGTFQASIQGREGADLFSFYDGPPFATGLPHYGHILAGTIKDVIPRYMTMKGYLVPRRFGWDCHGLPVENEIEKARELSGAASIEMFGIAAFNEECRSIVLRYSEEWKKTVNRMGRWVDFEKTYRTMDTSYMESIWWVFKQLWDKGLVYKGFKVMPFSAKLGTPLSNFEANLNYKDVDDPSVTAMMKIEGEENTFALVWTTTPWTLPSNLAICVNPEMAYVKVHDEERDAFFYCAKSRVPTLFSEKFEVVEELKGDDLKGKRYHPLFPFFVENAGANAFTILTDEFVGEADGTGIVHMAPAFGESDFFVCHREGIEIVCPVDSNGKFTKEIPELEGMFVKDADKTIIKRLKNEGKIFHHGQIRHRYPFCWRSDTPLIYKAVDTWFVNVESLKERMLEANEQIHWVPGHIKHGRFGKWLENARDWAISRNRYWGTPIPIWMSDDADLYVIGSIQELETLTGKKIDDIHRHFIDDLSFEKDGKVYRRVSEVFDCWFESGSMPYAQNHYPFENGEVTEASFPADFIGEGLDQTRGWFYTLTILAVALFDKPAFKNVIVNGIILAEDGAKMSKRLKNYPEPEIVFNKYGADAVRLFLLHSPVVEADDLKFSERGVELVLRQILIPFWNSYVFFATYANIYNWKPDAEWSGPEADIDRWILSRVQGLIESVEKGMDSFELSKAVNPFVGFIDELTNWYIRRCRSRFWSDEESQDRQDAFQTLYMVLKELTKVTAPFIPFISEAIYGELRVEDEPSSVHLCDFPKKKDSLKDETLEREMALVQAAVSMGHSLRKEHKVKVRQPLPTAHLISADKDTLHLLQNKQHLIMDELNVKSLEFHADEAAFVRYAAKPNYKTLGRRAGKHMKDLKAIVEAFDLETIRKIQLGKSVQITVDDTEYELLPDDIEIVRSVKEGVIAQSDGAVTIALDTTLSEELLLEGLAREIVNKVNTMRRAQGFEVTDRISLIIDSSARVQKAFSLHESYIRNEILAGDVRFESSEGEEIDLNGEKARLTVATICAHS